MNRKIILIILLILTIPLVSAVSFNSFSVNNILNDFRYWMTGKAVSEDCTLFEDNFESGSGKWNFMSSTGEPITFGNEWSIISDGTNVLKGNNHNWAYLSEENSWDNYIFRAKIKIVGGGIHINFRRAEQARYFLGFNQEGLFLNKQDSSGTIKQNLISDNSAYNLNEWYNFKIVLDGSNIKIYVNDILKIDYTDTSPLTSGSVAFETLDNSVIYFDDIKISGACVTPSIQQCTDSDNGIIYNLKGTISGIDPVTNQYATKTDFCHKLVSDNVPLTSGPYLFEYACQANTNKISWYGATYCEHGCVDGACVEVNQLPVTVNCGDGICTANEISTCSQDCANHCSDGIYNGGEEGLDCGWTCPNQCSFIEKSGTVNQDETWSGNILITSTVIVPQGLTLTIEPGTIVKFKYDRNYKTFDKAGLHVVGGTIKAIGKKDKMIWFTSAAPDPINGDWNGLYVGNSLNSIFDYVMVEYGEMGIEQFDSKVIVRNSIIRWINAEGLYAERSQPIFENNLLYNNGYHEIALEQYNTNVQIKNNIFHNEGIGGGRNPPWAIHHEKTESHIEGNYFYNYKMTPITAGMESNVQIIKNKFRDIQADSLWSIYGDSTAEIIGNDLGDNSVNIPILDIKDIKNFELDYVPGDTNDRFPYVYSNKDETREVINKIGADLSFGWSLVYVNGFLYRFTLGNVQFVKVNPNTNQYEMLGNDETNKIMNPRGLTWDGEFFYVNDFSLLKIFKFKIENNKIKVVSSFDIPEKEKGGTSGLTTDGEFLYLRSRDGSKVYKLDKNGNLINEIQIPGGTLVWTGNYFWTVGGCGKGICKWTKEGVLVGEIYPTAKDTWAITWDGNYLWTIQRTCEHWNDPKIYQIKILDDSLGSIEVKKPNVLLIVSDSLRADHLSSYGYERITSPNLDTFALQGVRFTNAISQAPWTLESFSSFLSSLYTPVHKALAEHPMDQCWTTLAEVLRNNGYKTVVYSNGADWAGPKYQGQGFDEFYNNGDLEDVQLTFQISNWLENNKGNRFFMMTHYMSPHSPYNAPEPYKNIFIEDNLYNQDLYPNAPGICEGDWGGENCIGKAIAENEILDIDYYVAKYDGEIKSVDNEINKLLNKLDELGIKDDTLIVFISDHGEIFAKHGIYLEHAKLYDDTLHVPLIMRYPKEISQSVVNEEVQSIDVMPTIMDILRIAGPQTMQGKSLLPLIQGKSNESDEYAFSGEENYIRSVRTKDWKFIKEIPQGSKELYNLQTDPEELNNIINQQPQIAQELESKLNDWLNRCKTITCDMVVCNNDGICDSGETPENCPSDCQISTLKCTQGCSYNKNCIPFGYRVDTKYCSLDGNLIEQKETGTCNNHFECRSNLCISDECVEQGLWEKIMDWFRKLFG